MIDFFDDILASKTKVRFLSESYKHMPPIGMEIIAPIMVNLSEEIAKINEILPKILDIKTEVLNTADTVRQLKIDMNEIKSNFTGAISGLKEASNDIVGSELDILEDLRSFRQSITGIKAASNDVNKELDVHENLRLFRQPSGTMNDDLVTMSSQETEKTTPPHRYETTVNLGPDTPKENAEPPRRSYSGVTRLSTGATSKRKNSALNVNRIQDITNQSIHGTPNMERVAEWTVAGEKQKAHRQRQRFRRDEWPCDW